MISFLPHVVDISSFRHTTVGPIFGQALQIYSAQIDFFPRDEREKDILLRLRTYYSITNTFVYSDISLSNVT